MTREAKNIWERLISAEVLISLVVMLITFVNGYSVLADDQKEQEVKIETLTSKQETMQDSLHLIEADVGVIRNDIKWIRKILEDTHE